MGINLKGALALSYIPSPFYYVIKNHLWLSMVGECLLSQQFGRLRPEDCESDVSQDSIARLHLIRQNWLLGEYSVLFSVPITHIPFLISSL